MRVRIAVVSDIHGNLMALDAVMTDLEKQAPDAVWCGGDIGWGGPWASECIERVRREGWITVKGNTDIWITGDPQTIDDETTRKSFIDMAAVHDISEDDSNWLLNLPLGYTPAGSVLLVHGTPQSPFIAPEPNGPAAEFAVYEDRAQVVIYGHVHKAFVRRLASGTIVTNPGSVGLPLDDDTASYLLLDRDGADITLTHRRVAYDRRAMIAQVKRSPEPMRSWALERLHAEL
ncbi:MAG: metallophosphoesterase family protein [Actinomycetota bacterium]